MERAPTAPATEAISAPAIAPSAADRLGEEVRILSEAQQALRNHRPEDALRALDEHAREFPEGTLRQERMAARVLALCDLGRIDEARAEGRVLREEAPSSPMTARIRQSCAEEP